MRGPGNVVRHRPEDSIMGPLVNRPVDKTSHIYREHIDMILQTSTTMKGRQDIVRQRRDWWTKSDEQNQWTPFTRHEMP